MAATAKKKTGRTRANSKSGAVRAYLAKNPEAGPTEVARELKKAGIQISPAHVSAVKAALKRSTGANGHAANGRGRRGRRPASADAVSLNSLIEARVFAARVGGVEKARELITALARLQS